MINKQLALTLMYFTFLVSLFRYSIVLYILGFMFEENRSLEFGSLSFFS